MLQETSLLLILVRCPVHTIRACPRVLTWPSPILALVHLRVPVQLPHSQACHGLVEEVQL